MRPAITKDIQHDTFKAMIARKTTVNLGDFCLFGFGFDIYAYDSGNGHERYGFLLTLLGDEVKFLSSMWGFSSPVSALDAATRWAADHNGGKLA